MIDSLVSDRILDLMYPKGFVSKPTLNYISSWIRVVHGIHILIIPTVTSCWTYKTITVITERDNDAIIGLKKVSDIPPYDNVCGEDFKTHDEALESALFEQMKIILNHNENK